MKKYFSSLKQKSYQAFPYITAYTLAFTFAYAVFSPNPASAKDWTDIQTALNSAGTKIAGIGGSVSTLSLVVAGIVHSKSHDEINQEKSKKAMKAAMGGLAVSLLAGAIVGGVQSAIG